MRTVVQLPLLCLSVLHCGCEAVNPAGTGHYDNPSYPAQEKGYFFCGQSPAGCAFAPMSHTVWITEPVNGRLFYKDVSQAVVNPVISDTLFLHFSPDLISSPPGGVYIYVSENGGNGIYRVDTQALTYQKVYSCSSTIYAMKHSSDGGILFLSSRGAPWHIESVSTATWEQTAYHSTGLPMNRLEVSPNDSLIAVGNSGVNQITLLDGATLIPLDTLEMPMRIGTMAFLQDSRTLAALDASQDRPLMTKVDLITQQELYRSSPYNSYLINTRIPGTNTLLLPRNQDERMSVLNMDNMIFAPSIPADFRTGSICVSYDGAYIVSVSRTASPGRATVFQQGE